MRRAAIIVMTLVFGIALLALPGAAFAGDGCPGAKAAAAKKVCPSTQMTAEQCAKACDYKGECKLASFSVKGMTCAGCENTITGALEKVDGVIKVVSVSHKDEKAVVCYDPTKVKDVTLGSTISRKGYKAAVMTDAPAAAGAEVKAAKSGCAKSCAATCASKKACDVKIKTAATTDKTKTDGSK